VFGSTELLARGNALQALKLAYPRALLFGCSTAGEIHDVRVEDDSIVVTAIVFKHTTLEYAGVRMFDVANSFDAGERLARALSLVARRCRPARPLD
jgi:hypothetical protein